MINLRELRGLREVRGFRSAMGKAASVVFSQIVPNRDPDADQMQQETYEELLWPKNQRKRDALLSRAKQLVPSRWFRRSSMASSDR